MGGEARRVSNKWLYALIVLLLFFFLVLGVPLFPEFMATPVVGWLNLGMLLYLVLQLLGPLLAFIYLKQREGEA